MNDNHSDTDARTGQSSLSERIRKLEGEQNQAKAGSGRNQLPKNGFALAGRVTTELVSGVVVGGFAGYWLDNWLDTSPLLMIVMFLLGAIAGMMNVWRALSGRGMAAGYFDDKRTEDSSSSSEQGKQ